MLNALVYICNSSPDKDVFTLDNKYIYELFLNLQSSHYITYETIIKYMVKDFTLLFFQ